ncbi:MAG: polysaccharide biosynthesis protein [Clostridia bacterium]|nr:polysaccharide biosynthesis protein [Clostridia bacterium]
MKKRIKSLFTGAGALVACSFVGKLLGALYRIPLTNVLGGEGMGLYQMVFPLYTLILTLSSGGLPVALSRIISVRLSGGDREGATRALKLSLAVFTLLGGICSLILACSSRFIASVQGNEDAYLAYLAIAPAITFVSVLACMRGYWQGKENMLPSALSQIIEQVVKLSLGLLLARVMLTYGVEWSVFGALLGVSCAELLSALALTLPFLIFKKKWVKSENGGVRYAQFEPLTTEFGEDNATVLPSKSVKIDARKDNIALVKEILRLAIPVTFGSLVLPLTQVVDSFLVVNILSARGTKESATMAYGLFTGTVSTLINLPVVIIYALSVALLPRVAKLQKNQNEAGREAQFSLKTGIALGVLATLFFIVSAPDIVDLLYSAGLGQSQRSLCVSLIRISAISVFYVAVIQSATSVLQGLGKAKIPALNLAIGGVVKVLVTTLSLFFFGIFGAAIGTACCYAVTAILDLKAMQKRLPVTFHKKGVWAILIATGGYAVSALLLKWLFLPCGRVLSFLLSESVAFFLFFALLLPFGWFDGAETKRILPFFKQKR